MSAASLASRSLDSVTSLTTCSYSALLLSGSLAGSGASSAVDGESAASIRDRAASMPRTKQPAGLRLSDMGLVLAAASLTNHQPCPRAASFYVSHVRAPHPSMSVQIRAKIHACSVSFDDMGDPLELSWHGRAVRQA